ncbi:unnamed protein product [Phytophthora lilii]|uniref:Unnamed protein product n=1 Tax=Phytophthora lilii TaxID=2077276 RepID=A0A9W6TS18_9STRA|nr:unnamed protein product [Phytophthora lilii]
MCFPNSRRAALVECPLIWSDEAPMHPTRTPAALNKIQQRQKRNDSGLHSNAFQYLEAILNMWLSALAQSCRTTHGSIPQVNQVYQVDPAQKIVLGAVGIPQLGRTYYCSATDLSDWL